MDYLLSLTRSADGNQADVDADPTDFLDAKHLVTLAVAVMDSPHGHDFLRKIGITAHDMNEAIGATNRSVEAMKNALDEVDPPVS